LGDRWRELNVPATAEGGLERISCTSARHCEALFYGAPYRFDGRTWIAQPFPAPGGEAILNGVACTSQTACVAVGVSGPAIDTLLIERWNGRAWRVRPIPQPRRGGSLIAVACSSATACMAVGQANVAGPNSEDAPTRSITYRYDGSRWTRAYPPGPANAFSSSLASVACPSPRTCVAASSYLNGVVQDQAFADVWLDGRWRLTPVPVPAVSVAHGYSDLTSISCMGDESCVAVGEWSAFAEIHGALVETWNGASWRRRLAPLPLPPDGAPGTGTLSAISCGSSRACVGVGRYWTTDGAPRFFTVRRDVM